MPIVLVESMICGCPIVAFDCPTGPHELLDGGASGKLVRPGDTNAFRDALVSTLTNPDHSDSLASAGRLRANIYSAPVIRNAWMRCFGRVDAMDSVTADRETIPAVL